MLLGFTMMLELKPSHAYAWFDSMPYRCPLSYWFPITYITRLKANRDGQLVDQPV
jgi:hypothetical protein